MLLSEFVETKYLPYIRKSVRSNTYVGYEGSYKNYVKPVFGSWDLDDITVFDVQSWIDSFEKSGCARRAYATLRQIIRCATDWDMYNGKDPTKKHVKLPRTKGNQYKVLTSDEVRKLVEGFKGHPLEACVLCSVTMGLRRCESFGLTWSDINFETGEVYVHRSRQCVKGKEVVYPTKTERSTRTCYLPKFALDRLRQVRGNDNDYLLPVPVAKAPAMYKAHIEANDLPYTPFMNLRHTWATLAVELGTDITIVAKMLGHTDIIMAYSRYVRPGQSSYRQVQSTFNSIVSGDEVVQSVNVLDKSQPYSVASHFVFNVKKAFLSLVARKFHV